MVEELLGKTSKTGNFDSIFVKANESDTMEIPNSNILRMYYLDIANNKFDYKGLVKFLRKNIGEYVFSRATIKNMINDEEEQAIGLYATDLLRKLSDKDKGAGGELGELLLYLMLEHDVHAHKLLSKVELKTNSNMYVNGCDAVHLLQLPGETDSFQLVLGEAKIKNNLTEAVNEAFNSIVNVELRHDNDLRLLEPCIVNEAFDEKTVEKLKTILIPSKRDRRISTDGAFGIFLGYSLDTSSFGPVDNRLFRKKAVEQIEKDIAEVRQKIIRKITELNLTGYSFYCFVLPFNSACDDRLEIMKQIKGGA